MDIEVKPSFEDSVSVYEAKVLDEKERRVRLTIISVGPGNSNTKNFYTQDAIDTGVEIFEGATLGIDHPDQLQAKIHPEGDIEDIAGWLENVAVEGERIDADGIILPGEKWDWLWTLIKSSIEYSQRHPGQNLCGVSINCKVAANGTVDIDGEKWAKIVRFVGVRRVDIVTTPGRGGMFQKIISESKKNIEIFKARLKNWETLMPAMESAPEKLFKGKTKEGIGANLAFYLKKGFKPEQAKKMAMESGGEAVTDPKQIFAGLMEKVRNLETNGAPGIDEVRRQLDELGTAQGWNKTQEADSMDYPGADPTNPNPDPTAGAGAGGGAGDMNEGDPNAGGDALTPQDHAMAAKFHANQAKACQAGESGAGNPAMAAHHMKMAAFHQKKAAQVKPMEGGDGAAPPQPNAGAEAEAKAKKEAEAKAKESEEAKKKESEQESDPNFYGKGGIALLKETEMGKAGLSDAHKNFLRVSLESETNPTIIKKTIAAYAIVNATEAGGGHNAERRVATGAAAKKKDLVGALKRSGVIGEE